MSKARGLADLGNAYSDGALSNRNLIINGAMQVAQRGTSNGPNTTNGLLALDRWWVNASGGTKTISQETFAAGQTDVPDFPKYYMRLETTAGNNNLGVHQRVEDVTVLGGKTVTLSFWAKGTNPAGGSFASSWIQNFGSGGSASVETEAKSGIVLTSTWKKFTITFDVPSVSGKTIGTGSFTWVELLRQPESDTGTAGWTADIAQVQLELGDTATPFEHRSYSDELQRCQRYYRCGSTRLCFNGVGGRYGFAQVDAYQYRSTPSTTYTFSSSGYGTILSVGSYTPIGTTYDVSVQTAVGIGMDGIINWTADAEL